MDATGLYYYGARYYNPETGRFLTRDTLRGEKQVPQTLNRYVYCFNNPMKYIDPTGNESEDPQKIAEEVFQRLLDVDPEAYAEIQEQLDRGTITVLEALVRILELLGFHIDSINLAENSANIIVPETGLLLTIKIDNEMKDWGGFNRLTQTASINFAKSGKVTDIAAIILHEVSHSLLNPNKFEEKVQEKTIYGVEYSYMAALEFVGVEYSESYLKHVKFEALDYYHSDLIPCQKILTQWIEIEHSLIRQRR